ncbi:MAG: 2-C-methyl-D-erythritol 4-phosphate cytidylyltransferase [Candidatus Electryonea clarkiae]|nr:2-C-methyl-D-erythritol 4-phosphate cytidylyltransferase [Candidatus Electryonea clarkiae]MDP8287465.1 2-C-methyl-D-erythritol 4-phosphate cytidylyltransferase [Candidatus Electryonea clarkiae]
MKTEEYYTAAAILISSVRGKELGAKRPLCFIELDEKPVFVQAVDHLAASKRFREIILFLHEEWVGLGVNTSNYWHLNIVRSIIAGSEDHFITIKKGLTVLKKGYALVGIHDGARPLTPSKLIAEVMDEAFKHGFAIAVRVVTDEDHPDRDPVFDYDGKQYAVQSPLGIKQPLLRELIEKSNERCHGLIDLLHLAMENGIEPRLVIAEEENPKITISEDLDRCFEIIKKRVRRLRIS